MLAAEIHGKITDSSPPHQRMEDVLTSNVLSIFCYLNNLRIPAAFFSCARNLWNDRLDIDGLKTAGIFFWPRFSFSGSAHSREADALLILGHEGRARFAIAVEAKYESGLSNLYAPEMGSEKEPGEMKDESMIQFGHQLADEYCGIKCGHWDVPEPVQEVLGETQRKLLLYVTSNYEMPKVDLREARETISTLRKCSNAKNGCSSEADIYWVSWRELSALLQQEKACGFPDYSIGERNYLTDLLELLILRGLETFEPFKSLESVDSYTRFFTMRGFFQGLNAVKVYDPLCKNTLTK